MEGLASAGLRWLFGPPEEATGGETDVCWMWEEEEDQTVDVTEVEELLDVFKSWNKCKHT